MKKRFNKKQWAFGLFAFACLNMVGVFAPNQTMAQAADGNSCNELIPTCPTSQPVNLTQDQAGNVTATITIDGSTINIDVPDYDINNPPATVSATIISSTSSAMGNAISAKSADGVSLDYNSVQNLTGSVSAANNVVTYGPVTGAVAMVSTANGNSTQGETCCGGMNFQTTQNSSLGSISATAHADTAPDLGALSISVASSANNAAINGDGHGIINMVANQNNSSMVSASALGEICCNTSSLTQNALATGNTTASTSQSSTNFSWVAQNNSGNITADSTTNALNDGPNFSTTSQAVGNSGFVFNKWGYTEGNYWQNSYGNVTANASANLPYYTQAATIGSAAQGNSAVLSSIGSEGRLNAEQYTGVGTTITANTDFFGASDGGVGGLAASASGNALVGFACSVCLNTGIGMYGNSYQENGANNTANINYKIVGLNSSSSYGVAAGNSATYIAQSGY